MMHHQHHYWSDPGEGRVELPGIEGEGPPGIYSDILDHASPGEAAECTQRELLREALRAHNPAFDAE